MGCWDPNSSSCNESTTTTAASDAYYVVTQAFDAPINAVNLGLLTSGVLQQTVVSNISTPSVLQMVAGQMPFGASTGLLTQSPHVTWTESTQTMTLTQTAANFSPPALNMSGTNTNGAVVGFRTTTPGSSGQDEGGTWAHYLNTSLMGTVNFSRYGASAGGINALTVTLNAGLNSNKQDYFAINGPVSSALVFYTQLFDSFIGSPNHLAVGAVNGFAWLPTINGVPTTTPAFSGPGFPVGNRGAIVVDDVDYRIYGYLGGAWRDLTGSGGGGGITQLTGDVTAGPGSGSQAATIAKLSAFTTNGFVKTTGGTGTISIDTTSYQVALTSASGASLTSKFIVQGTTDTGLSNAQFLGALGTGLVKNTTTTGVLSIATAGTDYEVPLTFSTGLTRATNTITANLSTGITGGQSAIGGVTAGSTLTLSSTTHATKGTINFGTTANYFNEAAGTFVLGNPGTVPPGADVQFNANANTGHYLVVSNPNAGNAAQSALIVSNDGTGYTQARLIFSVQGTGFATSGLVTPSSGALSFAGGGSSPYIQSVGGTGDMIFAMGGTGSANERFRIGSAGTFTRSNINPTIASATSATLDAIKTNAATVVVSGTTNITTATGFNLIDIEQPTYTDASAVTVSIGATMTIKGAPIASGSLTLTTPLAFWVQAGSTQVQDLQTTTIEAAGVVSPTTDLTYDIGTSAKRWNNVYTAYTVGYGTLNLWNTNGSPQSQIQLTSTEAVIGCTAGGLQITETIDPTNNRWSVIGGGTNNTVNAQLGSVIGTHTGTGFLWILDANTNPTTNPTAGAQFYVDSSTGHLFVRTRNGSTQLAA